ncbi:MAG: nuclear transport factor 2 family protein [Bacteroidales bacterium]|nr:nuclear transport factor 2 family protein [Bacteroidales bacterium]
MKKLELLIFLTFILIMNAFWACNDKANNTIVFNEATKKAIEQEIIKLSDAWVANNVNMKPDLIVDFWDNSPDLIFAENGMFFTNRDSIHEFLEGFYSNTDKMEVEWLERSIIPLTSDVASMKGKFRFKASFKSGEVFEGKNVFTAVFLKKNNKWVLINGHESKIMEK